MAPSSALPLGAVRAVSEMQPLLVDPTTPGSGLLNSVLALLGPPAEDEAERYDEEVLDLHVIGFVVVCAPSHLSWKTLIQHTARRSIYRTGR
jgi:polyribonucleotide 5'-hydroxyl-kinase